MRRKRRRLRKGTRMNRSTAIDNWLFSVVVTSASQALIARDKLLRRIKKVQPNDCPHQQISRHSIASDSEILDAVLVTPTDEPARAALLICHGIGETVHHWLGVQKLLAAQGVASFVFDYSGFGRSTGHIRSIQCEKDAIAAFKALSALLPDTPISMLGFSLGSGIAAAVLDSVSPRKLILCSSFTSFQAAARCAGLPGLLGFLTPPIWNTDQSVRHRSLPILILHSENDRLFPVQMALNLAASCHKWTKFIVAPNQQHNDPFYRPRREYWEHVVSMLVAEV
jgi:uncharacterized protein